VVRVAEQRRVEAYREVVKGVAGKPGGLRHGLTLIAATDVVVVLFSADLYHALRHGRAWSATRTAEFLRRILSAELLQLPGRSGSSG